MSHVLDRQSTQVQTHGQNSRLRELSVGQKVMARNYRSGEKWIPGVVMKRHGPLSYEIETGRGVWRRHIDQLCGNAPKAGNCYRESDLDVTYEPDKSAVEPDEGSTGDGTQHEVEPEHQEDSMVIPARSEPEDSASGTSTASSGTMRKYPVRNRQRPQYYGFT